MLDVRDLLAVAPLPAQRAAVRTWRITKHVRRSTFERLGSDRFSRPALWNMDEKLRAFLPVRGIFVEAGANDGVQQSNTYHLERFGGWTGLLIEPVPSMAVVARRQRRCPVANVALVSSGYTMPTIEIQASGLTSIVPGSSSPGQHLPEIGSAQGVFNVAAQTLSGVLDDYGLSGVDFLSLDVEGYEPQVLAGLDLDRHGPSWMLIEIKGAHDAIERLIGGHYDCVAQLSPHDFLFRRR